MNRSENRSLGKFDWGDHVDNPWKFPNNVMVQKNMLRPVKLVWNEKKSDGFHILMLF